MTDHSLGDQPLEARFESTMRAVASVLDDTFNGIKKGSDREIGFVLLVFPFGDRSGRCNYVSNGADRRDVLKLLREQANRFEQSLKARP